MSENNMTPTETPYATIDASAVDTPARGEWEAGLCDCFSHCMPNCLMSWLCPCVSISQIAARLGVMNYWKALGINAILIVSFITMWIVSIALSFSDFNVTTYRTSTFWYKPSSNESDLQDSGSINTNPSDFGGVMSNDPDYATKGPGVFFKWTVRDYTAIRILQVLASLFTIICFTIIWYLRHTTRKQFELPGDWLGDCCASYWCSLCTIAQIATHVKSYKPGSCDFGPPDTLPAYA